MSGKYTVKVTNYFCGAHQLRNYEGVCQQMVHGHNYKVITEISARQLNETGMVIDFLQVRPIIDEVVQQLDHKFFNDIPPFDKINPTAENIAAWIYKNLSARINTEHIRIIGITLQETAHDAVHYTEE